jgi:peptide deformylase
VRGLDREGTPIELTGTGFFARCLQHETEHLSGVLYIDHLPRNRRRRVLRDMVPFEWNATAPLS